MTRYVPLLLLAALAGLFSFALYRSSPDVLPSAMIGKPLPQFSLPSLNGEGDGLSSADFGKGQAFVLNVFASWCAPCKVEHPVLMALKETHGVPIYAIAYKDDPRDTMGFLTEMGNPFAKIGVDRTGRVAIDLGVYGAPETYVIDAEGKVAFRHVGELTPEIISREILPRLTANGR